MSQVGTIISVANAGWSGQNITNWALIYTYALDAGGSGQAGVIVGNLNGSDGQGATVAMWANANAFISVTPPGVANPVLLPCPPQIQYAAFGVKSPGIPVGN
jgi:hypothetical protein